jgi:opacity protein-like surface antigen
MKRIVGVFALMAMLAAPALAYAGDQIGIYVAPKFVYGYARGSDATTTWSDPDGAWSDTSTLKIAGMDTWGGSIAVGYDFNKQFNLPLRAEVEYALFTGAESKTTGNYTWSGGGTSYWSKNSEKITVGIQTLFLNAYYDFRNSSAFTPYVGAGIGMAFLDAKYKETYSDSGGYSDSSSAGRNKTANFAWNIGAGVGYDITDYIAVDLGYRFVGLGGVKTQRASFDYDDDGTADEHLRANVSDLYTHQVALGLRITF